ncbi:MAG: DUF4845 domain-containing protein [Acidiferrobacterales bacterium]|jgi:hypothetical protein|nr:DUF4845 domain-containing protein [Acidiferrobacterales bacterium]
MQTVKQQQGITMWGMMGLALIGIFFVLLFFKLFPPYMEDMKIGSAIKRVANQPGAGSKGPAELVESIDKMFQIEDITRVTAAKDVEIIPRGENARLIKLEYEVVVPFAGNISILLEFDHAAEAR